MGIVELLLDKGADINALTKDEETPLFYACRKARARIVRLFLRRQCRIEFKNRFDDTAQDEIRDAKTLKEFQQRTFKCRFGHAFRAADRKTLYV